MNLGLIALGAATLLGIAELFTSKPKVFVSYDHSEDAHYKRLLQAWDANKNFKFEFDSRGPDEAIDSSDDSVIKAALTQMMKQSTHLLVLIGEKSHKSKWMEWEISKAQDLNLKIVAVRLVKKNKAPEGLLANGTTWVTSFVRDRIVKALES